MLRAFLNQKIWKNISKLALTVFIASPQFSYAKDSPTSRNNFESSKQDVLLPFCESHKNCGLLNPAGEIVFPAELERLYYFKDHDLLPVRHNNGKFGYLDRAGNIAISIQFEDASDFDEMGLARVKLDGKWGYINRKGDMVVPAEFDAVSGFNDIGMASVKIAEKWGYINRTGDMVIPAKFDHTWGFNHAGQAAVKLNGKWGHINQDGKMISSTDDGDDEFFRKNKVEAMLQLHTSPDQQLAYTYKGVPSVFYISTQQVFSYGLLPIMVGGKNSYESHFNHGGLWGYYNKAGETIIPPQFEAAFSFQSNGLAAVKINGKWGYIDKTGKMVVPARFDRVARSFQDNGLAWVQENGKAACIDETGKMVILPKDKVSHCHNSPVFVKSGSKWELIDATGKPVISETFSETKGFIYNDLAAVRKFKEKWKFIDRTGKIVISSKFIDVGPASNGLIAVMEKDFKWGFIDPTGKTVIPAVFDRVYMYADIKYHPYGADHKGYGHVSFGDKHYPINSDGALIGFTLEDVDQERKRIEQRQKEWAKLRAKNKDPNKVVFEPRPLILIDPPEILVLK